jgi:transposase
MKLNFVKKLMKKGRRHPIRRDQFGMTRRAWAFYYFDKGMSPAQAAHEAGITVRTSRRYKAQWNKRTRNIEATYKVLNNMREDDPKKFQSFVDLWAKEFGMAQEEVWERLQKPWGLLQLLGGKFPNYALERRRREAEADLDAALKFVKLMRIMGYTPDKIDEMIEEFIEKALKRKTIKAREDLTTTTSRPQAPSEFDKGSIRP